MVFFTFFTVVCPVPGEEVPMVCLLGRPWDPVLSGPWDWPAHISSLSGKRTTVAWKCVHTHHFLTLVCHEDGYAHKRAFHTAYS